MTTSPVATSNCSCRPSCGALTDPASPRSRKTELTTQRAFELPVLRADCTVATFGARLNHLDSPRGQFAGAVAVLARDAQGPA